ncbi:FAD-dependent monooxygenase [Streptomyces rapamycinicus]|uniref:FAD-dependent oxidoreductase n=2 Tax=Streptomyces rapamycinicus TaxID=1226757 RepID=A0A0A0NBP2_STRRN|nr:FAD-dependent monooxygenase [Streptomyces rapamycinicus]AGP53498.1 FAD-dependent oxidoreductase [Streptomyces rapamycinicus NRRL 5491]MBB4780985.1 2-polyprenyl-6-methoxyphenol hydroxylase-like FAD-dependent oxidoreductase [Streptomyces rapamycinicus]RLV74369.1 FAD-dependent oxidoreductase [Streptomyces rapamycinicus NRRL 5491]UTO61657.1 FAD-dependent monooxygenase [Streptomyces rapamycinicus]UTP29606.1 FAD-dependent monooxygenase [Streptomyces rapamycinicus NRRL 5491]
MTPTGLSTDVSTTARRRVLISGASISGPALAYWLHRAGCAVTVVEKASTPRDGGYPIDIRGTAIEVVRRMGILPRLRDAHIDSRRCTFLDADGSQVASVNAHAVAGSVEGQDLEVRRGDLAAILYEKVRDDVEFLFNDSIDTLDQSGQEADVTFHSGRRRTFDLVVGADGMHSHTRESLFGPEEQFHRYLGYCFAIFTMPNTFGLSHEVMMWNTPGKAAALYAVGDHDELHAFLTFHQPEPPFEALRNTDAQRDLVATVFAGAGWEVPGMVNAMRDADDLFFDTAGQIRMPHWSSGRVGLVGDAAYAPSFLTGQGSSLALAGAYMLADALAANRDHTAAFAAYERDVREFVAMNQALVDNGAATLFPTTARALEQRNTMLRGLVTMPSAPPRPAHSALTLPEFAPTP